LLKHIKLAICSKKAKDSALSGVLDQLQLKIEELKMVKIEEKEEKENADSERLQELRLSYENSSK